MESTPKEYAEKLIESLKKEKFNENNTIKNVIKQLIYLMLIACIPLVPILLIYLIIIGTILIILYMPYYLIRVLYKRKNSKDDK